MGISLYYEDPDQNRVEISASNYSDAWTATEHLSVSRGMMMADVDLEKMVTARELGASPWELHEHAVRGDFAPEKRTIRQQTSETPDSDELVNRPFHVLTRLFRKGVSV